MRPGESTVRVAAVVCASTRKQTPAAVSDTHDRRHCQSPRRSRRNVKSFTLVPGLWAGWHTGVAFLMINSLLKNLRTTINTGGSACACIVSVCVGVCVYVGVASCLKTATNSFGRQQPPVRVFGMFAVEVLANSVAHKTRARIAVDSRRKEWWCFQQKKNQHNTTLNSYHLFMTRVQMPSP